MADNESLVRSTSQMLQDGLDEVFSTAAYRRFLAFVANNPNYSYRNVLLILQQCPNASKVMGFKAWLRQGRAVNLGERGIRITALFDKRPEEDMPPPPPPRERVRNKKKKDRDKFRRISVFDISQTSELDGDDAGNRPAPNSRPVFTAPVDDPLTPPLLEGEVYGYELLLDYLNQISPLPIVFRSGVKNDGVCGYADITIKKDMSQLHTVRTVINQIVHCWRRPWCPDREQLAIEAESCAFIVCQYLGLDTSDFSFQYIAKYSLGKERHTLEEFLDVIQKTALMFIDSIDGLHLARQSNYENGDFCLLQNSKTASRLLRQGTPVYLVFLGEGELFALNQKQIEEHEGPFAVERSMWFDSGRLAA